MIEEILKFSSKHPKGVILALLTIIAAGGIAGGLWIHNLQSALEERDKTISERLALIEERHRDDMRALRKANAVLHSQGDVIKSNAKDIAQQLREVALLADEIRTKGAVTDEIGTKLRSASESITTKSEHLSQALERAQDAEMWLRDMTTANAPPPTAKAKVFNLFYLVALIVLVLLPFAVIRYAWKRRSN